MNLSYRWEAHAAGTSSGATATKSSASGKRLYVTQIAGHTDTDSLIQILEGSTVVWEQFIDVSADGGRFNEAVGAIPIAVDSDANGKVVTSTTDCFVSIQGVRIP